MKHRIASLILNPYTVAALACPMLACAGTTANAATCTAYEAAVAPARAVCHRACDAVPSECPWRDESGEQ